MKQIKHNKNQLNDALKWRDIFAILCIMLIACILGYFWTLVNKPLSPCPISGCSVTKVEAAEIEEKIALKKEVESLTNTLSQYTDNSRSNLAWLIYQAWEKYGPEKQFQALNVAKNESGLRVDAMGYNCRYGEYSQACKAEDRHRAWSVDCGLFQINVIGKTCPTELFDPKVNIEKAVKMYNSRGWKPWVAAKNLGYTN